jgi:hypothetical protein
VKVRAADLHPVLWRGRQWAVTEYGIECLDGTYAIQANRLTAKIERFGGPGHMRGKVGRSGGKRFGAALEQLLGPQGWRRIRSGSHLAFERSTEG